MNAEYYDAIYEKYLADPKSVDPTWATFFSSLTPSEKKEVSKSGIQCLESDTLKAFRVFNLIHSYRLYGHLASDTNPILTGEVEEPEELRLSTLGFGEEELDDLFPAVGLTGDDHLPLREILQILKDIYCGAIGVEYMDRHSSELEHWLQGEIEPSRFKIKLNINQKQMILERLNKSGLFETFLQTKYVGQKRFSLEGGETLIPIFSAILETGNQLGMEDFVIGMAHRGRLNVLTNILGKSYSDVFGEFEDIYGPESFEGSGDVKYHKGYNSTVELSTGKKVNVSITPNASHLESASSIVEGLVRAKQDRQGDEKSIDRIVPILVHGDAALSGQGIVYENLQFSDLKGYKTGGTVHIVINNQIGFTTLPKDSRSTYYCTDIARTFGAPVFHVNAEDPEACVYATILAIEIRQRFHCDVFIDLVCYRKYGHNEADEPAFTQPLEYRLIRQKDSIREIYRDRLHEEGSVEKAIAEKLEEEFKEGLNEALKKVKERGGSSETTQKKQKKNGEIFAPVKTGVEKSVLENLAKKISEIPENFSIHRKLKNLVKQREQMVLGEAPLDWGMAELMAYASLLSEKTSIRISGQDVGRGTFSHRHALWMDQENGTDYIPLQHLSEEQGHFSIYNSHLSEYAVLGFEYGYSIGAPKDLTIWEAQFGDFSNGAQIIIDQYISTGEQKWGQHSNLALFLPHGYEGQGPEHSSARIERFLTLCGQDNLIVMQPSTPAQLFHAIRRQIHRPFEKPMVVFTPKALLRLPACVSDVQEFSDGSFQEIIDDPKSPKEAKKLVFCSGKIFYDLLSERDKRENGDVAIIRIEQLYPLHQEKLMEIIAEYKNVKEWTWAQDEPSNMGAWNFIRHYLARLIPKEVALSYAGRERSASPATGSHKRHEREHSEIIEAVFKDSL